MSIQRGKSRQRAANARRPKTASLPETDVSRSPVSCCTQCSTYEFKPRQGLCAVFSPALLKVWPKMQPHDSRRRVIARRRSRRGNPEIWRCALPMRWRTQCEDGTGLPVQDGRLASIDHGRGAGENCPDFRVSRNTAGNARDKFHQFGRRNPYPETLSPSPLAGEGTDLRVATTFPRTRVRSHSRPARQCAARLRIPDYRAVRSNP